MTPTAFERYRAKSERPRAPERTLVAGSNPGDRNEPYGDRHPSISRNEPYDDRDRIEMDFRSDCRKPFILNQLRLAIADRLGNRELFGVGLDPASRLDRSHGLRNKPKPGFRGTNPSSTVTDFRFAMTSFDL